MSIVPTAADLERAKQLIACARPAVDWAKCISPTTRAFMASEHKRFERMRADQPVLSKGTIQRQEFP